MSDLDDKEFTPKRGLKNQAPPIAKRPTQQDLQQKVSQELAGKKETNEEGQRLALNFVSLVKDKTLVNNKTNIQKMHEVDSLAELIKHAEKVNLDPNEKDAAGSVLLCALLLKTVFHFRDRMNELEFANTQLQHEVQRLKSENEHFKEDVEELKSKINKKE
jgi:hypothetical protein